MLKFKALVTVVAFLLTLSGTAYAETLKVGVLATLEGAFTVLGEDGVRGVRQAVAEANEKAGGLDIELIIGPTDATPDSAVRAARKLVEQDGVDIIVGPLSGSEGIAMRDFSKDNTGVTFINGASAALETTYVTPSENFFRFGGDGAQWSAGLGNYIYNEKGYRYIATVAEDYSFPYTQVLGLVTEFCAAGGEVTSRQWVPLGAKDFGSVIAALPDDVDAIYLALGGADAVNFLNQYQQAGGDAKLVGGTIMVDQSVLSSTGSAKNALIGTPSSGPQVDSLDTPAWKKFVASYQSTFKPEERFPSPSVFALSYYNATSAAIQCMDSVNGDLSNNQSSFRQCLANHTLDSPTGPISLDDNRQGIITNFVTEVREQADGTLATELVSTTAAVPQTLGMSAAGFASIGLPSRDNPECKSSY